jgi:hypothetical protein
MSAGTRFLDALWELQAAKKVLADSIGAWAVLDAAISVFGWDTCAAGRQAACAASGKALPLASKAEEAGFACTSCL